MNNCKFCQKKIIVKSILPLILTALIIVSIITIIPTIAAKSSNIQEIEGLQQQINNKGYNYTVAENWITQLSPMEREALCGYKPRKARDEILSENIISISDASKPIVKKETSEEPIGSLPPSYNAIALGYVTSIKNQNSCGSCWIFAAVSDFESDVAIKESSLLDFSEQQVGDCNIWSSIGGFNFCDGGNAYFTTNYLTKYGSTDETCNPYEAMQGTCEQCPILRNVDNWRIITESDGNELFHVNTIKNAILNYGPVYSTIYSGSIGFIYYNSGVYEYWGPEPVNHAIEIIGWNDSLSHSKGTGAWLIKNSWGESWGLESYPGCAWVAYGSANIGDMTSAISGYKYPGDTIFYHDEGGWLNDYGYNDPVVYGAVRFTPSNDSTLTAVDFWAVDTNMNYEIKIFDSLSDLGGEDYNFSDQLGNTQTGTTNERGYYSILLDTPVLLTSGDDFIIQIKFTTSGSRYPLPIEDNTIFTFSDESYSSYDGLKFKKSSPYDIGIRARAISQTTITEPEEGAYVKETIFINGTADDTDFKNYSVEWKNTTVDWFEIKNSTEPVSDGILAAWDTTAMEDGDYSIKLTVIDIASSSINTLVNVTIDNTQPTAIITKPGEGTLINGSVDITGTANDTNFKNYKLELKNTTVDWFEIKNSTGYVSGGILATWDTTAMDDGDYSIKLTVTDKALNSNMTIINITVDNIQLNITDVNSVTTSSTATITWNTIGYFTNSIVKYNESGNQTILEKINTEYVESHAIQLINLKASTIYYYYVISTDQFGNTNESSIFSFTTSTVPLVIIHSPPPITNDSTPVLNASFDRTVTSAWYVLDGASSSGWHNIDHLSVILPERSDGLHRVVVDAIDYEGDFIGNIGTAIQNFLVDTTLPVAIITLPDEGAYINGETAVDIIGTANDTNFKNYKLELKDFSGDWIEIENSFHPVQDGTLGLLSISDMEDGNYIIKLTVIDNASNVNYAKTNITIDNTPPTAIITKPQEGTLINGPVDITGTANDANFKNYSIEWKNTTVDRLEIKNSAGYVSGGILAAWDTTTMEDGDYSIKLTVTDIASNVNYAKTNITIDNTPSDIIITNASNSTFINAPDANVALELFTNKSIIGSIGITRSIVDITNEFKVPGPGIYIKINASTNFSNDNYSNLSWALIKVYYTDEDMNNNNLNESSLCLYWYNESKQNWIKLETNSLTWVYGSGVDIANNYVWANVSHFSDFAIGGILKEETQVSSSSNSGGGGGGGGTSGEDFYNIVLSETDRQIVFKNSIVSFCFELEGNTVRHINFTALNSAGTVAAKIEMLQHTSTLVSNPPPDEVYKNLNIWVGNYGWATEKNIADTTVNFIVDKSWVTNNDISDSSISLYHYSDDNWGKLVTKKTGEDPSNLYFEAKVTGFSPFAVTGKKAIAQPGGEGIIVEPAVTAEKTPVPTPTKSKGIPGSSLSVSVLVLLITVQLIRKTK